MLTRLKTAWHVITKPARARGYDAAIHSRLTSDWVVSLISSNEEIKRSLTTIRARSRDAVINDSYASRYIRLLDTNVIGERGIQLQLKAKNLDGTADTFANLLIEAKYKDWGKPANCTPNGKTSWLDLQRLVIKSVPRDGELFIRKLPNYRGNPYRFALQPLEADHVDHTYNDELRNGNRVILGIELNADNRPVAYHTTRRHPGDSWQSSDRERIPADQMIHIYVQERPGQLRGVPWLAPVLIRARMLKEYEISEAVAARVAACKMGFFSSPDPSGLGAEGNDGRRVKEASPGAFEWLPKGHTFTPFDPNHPVSAFKDFVSTVLRGFAAGLNQSYTALSGDLSGVSFSSYRQDTLNDRDQYMIYQRMVIDQLCDAVYPDWLSWALITGQLDPLPLAKESKFLAATWKPRRWPWVDPLKDGKLAELKLKNHLTTHAQVIADMGEDQDDVWQERAGELPTLAALNAASTDYPNPPDPAKAQAA